MRDVGIALLLVAIALVISRRQKLALERDLLVAVGRALVQLLVVAGVIHLVFEQLGLSGLFLVVMLGAAAWTSSRRLAGVPGALPIAAVAIAAGSFTALAILFGLHAFPLEPQWLIPISGMLFGNAMIATSLAGSRLRDEMSDKTLEVEARLALGVSAHEALSSYARRAVTTSLIPTIDATKNVGLIHLPGAFVGMMLGGATPLEAAKVQLIVLFMLLGAISITAFTAAKLVGRAFIGPGERILLPATSR